MWRASIGDFPLPLRPVSADVHVWFRSIDGGTGSGDAVAGGATVDMTGDEEFPAGFSSSQQRQQNNSSSSLDVVVVLFLLLVLDVASFFLPHSR